MGPVPLLSKLTELQELYGWGTTHALDWDLSALFELPSRTT